MMFTECRRAFRRLYGLPPIDDASAPASDPAIRLSAARRHRLTGLLQAGGAGEAGDPIRSAAYGQARHAARLTAEAERLFARLDSVLPTVVLIKGPALARQAWPAPGLRAFDDLDIRCPKSGWPALENTLTRAGYQPCIADRNLRSHLWHYGWGVAFRQSAGIRVEANHRGFPPHFPGPDLSADRWPERFALLALDNAPVRAPTPPLHLLLSCLHAFWHGGERMAWMVDIAGLLVRHPAALDVAEVWAGRNGFARRALHTGCRIAERLLGPGLVHGTLPWARESAVRIWIAQVQAERGATPAARRTMHLDMLRGPEKALYTLRRALIPGSGDFRRLPLPPRLRPLYWLYRPGRIAVLRNGGRF